MLQAYSNIQKLLAQYGAAMDNIVDEILFVTDMDAAFAAAVKCREKWSNYNYDRQQNSITSIGPYQ